MNRHRSVFEWATITLILLVAAVLRFHDLGNVPQGLEHDEVATWHMVTSVLEGQHPIFFEEGYGHEPLFNYLTALPMAIWGPNWLGERFWAPWLGLLAVATTYALMRRLFGPLIGLGAAGLQATVLWALFFNRLGLRLNQLPFLLCLAMYCFWRGLEATGHVDAGDSLPQQRVQASQPGIRAPLPDQTRSPASASWAWFVAAGALMGLCFYTYMSARVVPLMFAAFSAYLVIRSILIRDRERDASPGEWLAKARRQFSRWWPLLACFAVAGLVMLPLALYLLNRPMDTTIPQRESQVDRPLQELKQGNLQPVLENAWALIKMWNVDGERYWQLNYSHRPVFVEPISGILFWVGMLAVLWRWKEPRMALLLIWIGLGMVPSLLTSEAPSWPRTMLASPAALALPGIAVQSAIRLAPGTRKSGLVPSLLAGLLALSVLLTAVLTYRDFIVIWPRHPRVRYAFQSSMTEAFRYLDAADDTTPLVMAGLSAHDMDPWTQRCTLRRNDLSIRWTDTRSALVLPADATARLVILDITPMDPLLSLWIGLDRASILAQGEMAPRGSTEHENDVPWRYDPAYTVFRLDLSPLRQRIQDSSRPAYIGSDPSAPDLLAQAPQFGGLVRLLGYQWLTPLQPAAEAHLLTFWQALGTGPYATRYGEPALRIFVHLLDHDQVVGQDDALGTVPNTWQEGDVIVQLHTLALPASPGHYALELGWYVPPDGPRLPVDGVDAPGQRILLEPVEIRP